MSAESDGYYVLTTWAAAGDVNAAQVRANFKGAYGVAAVESMGRRIAGMNFGVLQDKFRDAIDDGASKLNPTMADINSAMLAAGGTVPSAVDLALGVGKDTLDAAATTGKVLIAGLGVTAVIGFISVVGLVYVLYKSGALKELAKNVKMPLA